MRNVISTQKVGLIMKNGSLFVVLLGLGFLTTTVIQADGHADWSCSDNVKTAVAAQAQIDFPGQTLTVVMPAFNFDGGRVQSLDVSVQNGANQVVATYDVEIDEVCNVEVQPL
jgi:diacylglycerol kinase family enzyme